MNTYKIEQANEIPDAQAVTEPYNEDAIRAGALEMTVERQRAEIAGLKAENERLLGCIRELEREELEKPHRGFSSYDTFADAREWAESPHSDHQDGQVDNTTGAFAHLI